mgnify:CR=1 FL=1
MLENLNTKEKRLEAVLEKLKNLSGTPDIYSRELDLLQDEKNQLQSEKVEIEKKYDALVLKYKLWE